MIRKFGEFELDESARKLKRAGAPIRLAGQTLDLLCLLVRRPGELLSRDEIKHSLWPDSNSNLEHSLDVVLNRLRTTLGDSGKTPRYIETVPRKGYRFLAEVKCEQHSVNQLPMSSLIRKAYAYVAIALLAAAIMLLIARTRYQKFVPSNQAPVPAKRLEIQAGQHRPQPDSRAAR